MTKSTSPHSEDSDFVGLVMRRLIYFMFIRFVFSFFFFFVVVVFFFLFLFFSLSITAFNKE